MELPEDEIVEKYGKKCIHCTRNTLQSYEYHYTCIYLQLYKKKK